MNGLMKHIKTVFLPRQAQQYCVFYEETGDPRDAPETCRPWSMAPRSCFTDMLDMDFSSMSGSMDLESARGRACGLSQEGLAEGARLLQGRWLIQ